jgi:alkylation response protein AidB-like acyl-CoA dehydrogenase
MPVSVGLDASGQATPALLKKLQALGADVSQPAAAVAALKQAPDGKAQALFYDSLVKGASLAAGLQKALDEALARSRSRQMFGGVLADLQLTQAKLAQMATAIDSAALLTYRAAWQRDRGQSVTREAAMAKMVATENAQQVIDAAVQIWGGLGVVSQMPVERLYREIRALRIYEGATEVQQLIIARELLKGGA